MKILFCTDFTDAANYSFDKAFPFLKKDCKVDIISVIETGLLDNLSGNSTPKKHLDLYRDILIEKLGKVKLSLESKGLNVENIFYPQGNPADKLLEHLKTTEYNLLIIGSRSKKLLGTWLGSTSRKIAGKSNIPVFIARQNGQPTATTEKKEVLFTVDGNQNSYNAIKIAPEIFDLENSTIEILYVKQGTENLPIEIVSDGEWLRLIMAKQQELAEETIEHALEITKEKNLDVTSKTILEGSPVEKILKHLKKTPKDLVVMGSHGREGISSLLLGSVSKGILNNAHNPVLIIPTKKDLQF